MQYSTNGTPPNLEFLHKTEFLLQVFWLKVFDEKDPLGGVLYGTNPDDPNIEYKFKLKWLTIKVMSEQTTFVEFDNVLPISIGIKQAFKISNTSYK